MKSTLTPTATTTTTKPNQSTPHKLAQLAITNTLPTTIRARNANRALGQITAMQDKLFRILDSEDIWPLFKTDVLQLFAEIKEEIKYVRDHDIAVIRDTEDGIDSRAASR